MHKAHPIKAACIQFLPYVFTIHASGNRGNNCSPLVMLSVDFWFHCMDDAFYNLIRIQLQKLEMLTVMP